MNGLRYIPQFIPDNRSKEEGSEYWQTCLHPEAIKHFVKVFLQDIFKNHSSAKRVTIRKDGVRIPNFTPDVIMDFLEPYLVVFPDSVTIEGTAIKNATLLAVTLK
jgi:hypothetical protein